MPKWMIANSSIVMMLAEKAMMYKYSLFNKKLNQVVSADPSLLKQARLINELSKLKAKHYLSNKSKYF